MALEDLETTDRLIGRMGSVPEKEEEEEGFVQLAQASPAQTTMTDAAEEDVDPLAAEKAELEAFLLRNNITLTGEEPSSNLQAVPGGGIAVDVTAPISAATESDGTLDYEAIYGASPEKPSFGSRITAGIQNLSESLGNTDLPPSPQQTEMAQYEAANALFEAEILEGYEKFPTVAELGSSSTDDLDLIGGDNVRVFPRVVTDDEGNVVTEYVRIPPPDSTMWTRILGQAGRDVFQQFAGLATEGAVLRESEIEQRILDYETEGFEELATDILSFGFPAIAAERLGRGAGGLIAAGRSTNLATRVNNTAKWVGASIGASYAEAVMSTEGDEGMIFTPEQVAELFRIENPEDAASAALIFDGMVFNGIFDGAMAVLGGASRFVGDRVSGVRLLSQDYRRRASETQAILGAFNVIDPMLNGSNFSRNELVRNMRSLATVLDANSERLVRVGQSQGEVPLDTVTAVMDGATQYIRATRVGQRRAQGMNDEQWEEYVQTEANMMVERTIRLARTRQGAAEVASASASMLEGTGRVLDTEVARLGGTADNVSEGADNLVNQYNEDVLRRQRNLDAANQDVANLEARIGTAVSDDEFVRDLISAQDPIRFFDDRAEVERLRGLLGDELVDEYRTAWQSVNDAYAAIDNVPIDTEMFIGDVNRVVRDANLLDASGGQTKRILGEIYRAVQPQQSLDAAGDMVIETADELLERLDGQIGFQDLYRVRQRLSNMIGETNDPAIRSRLTELKGSITDANTGQLGFVLNSGDDAAAAAAQAADDLYIRTKSRFDSTEPMRRLSALARERSAGFNTPNPDGFTPRGQGDVDAFVTGQLPPTLASDPSFSLFRSLREAFPPEKQAMLDEVVGGHLIATGTSALATALRNNDNQTADLILSSFSEQAKTLRETGNPLYRELEEAAARIESIQKGLGSELEKARLIADQAQAMMVRSEDRIVSRFLDPNAPGQALSNPIQIVNNLISGANGPSDVQALMGRINALPPGEREATRSAFQGAILRSVREQVFTATPISVGATDVALGRVRSINSETANSVLQSVRTAFPDEPEVVEGLQGALDFLQQGSIPPRLRVARAGSDTEPNRQLSQAVSTTILATLGYMNPGAATARRLTSGPVAAIEKQMDDTVNQTVAVILSAPREFAALLKAEASNQSPRVINEATKLFFAAAADGIRYQVRTDFNEFYMNVGMSVDQAMENMFDIPEGFEE
jgi:hypothetical protein